jgi:hypothetical protein
MKTWVAVQRHENENSAIKRVLELTGGKHALLASRAGTYVEDWRHEFGYLAIETCAITHGRPKIALSCSSDQNVGGRTKAYKRLFGNENMCYSSREAKNILTSLREQNMGCVRES